jgi:hypothetical protein
MIIEKVPPPVTRNGRCDRCPAASELHARVTGGELLFCRHHARVHCDGLLAAGAVLSFVGQKD